MFLESNWTANAYQFRIGDTFTDFRGVRSWETLKEARSFFASHGCGLIKHSSRTWEIVILASEA